jgi:hypothetical protein
MPRIKKEIDIVALQKTIENLELKQQFTNRSELFQAVSNSNWGKSVGISPSLVYLRVNEHGLQLKTPVGKRGRSSIGRVPGQTRNNRKKEYIAQNSQCLQMMLKEHRELPLIENIVEKIGKGSLKTAVKLKCLECSGLNKSEVKWCQVKACPLWLFRPYKPKPGEKEK